VLDEPLSGLDSNLADIVLAALSETARTRRTTVLMSVHQPSASMWAQFDRLLLMAEGGRTAFFGDASEATVCVVTVRLHLADGADRMEMAASDMSIQQCQCQRQRQAVAGSGRQWQAVVGSDKWRARRYCARREGTCSWQKVR
jgi:ABC-type multidrug transport system ATPase subunit